MKKIILITTIIFVGNLFGQTQPTSFNLGNEPLSKLNDSTPLSNSTIDIAITDDVVWLATSRGLSKTEDNGDNWVNYFGGEDFGTEGIFSLRYNNGIVWTTTGHTFEEGSESLPEGSGIRYSTDNGETWTIHPQSVDNPGDSLITYGINIIRALPVTTKVNNVSFDLAVTQNTIWTANFAGGLRKSTDNGATWERVILPPDHLDSIKPTDTLDFALQPVAGAFGDEAHLNHRVFSVIGIDDTTLYAGTAGGINKSTDNGISWVKFNHQNQQRAISGNFVTALGYDVSRDDIWAATWKADDQTENWGVSFSGNGGQTWDVVLPGERAHNFGFKYFGSVGNYSSSHVFAPTDNGVFRSSDKGNTWISPPSIKDDETLIPIATTEFFSVETKRQSDGSTDIWIGSANGLARLNEQDGFWNGTWKVFLASADSDNENETFAFPNPFSPRMEPVKIKYFISGSSSSVTIRIMDFGMNLVRTLIQNAPRGGDLEQIEFWDGRDENGELVANGTYFYRVDVDSRNPAFGKIMVLK